MEHRTILIDGYNVIRNMPGLIAAERCSLQAGRDALLCQVVARYRHTPHTIVVVFDGDGGTESSQPLARGVRGCVIFTRRGDSADAVLHRIAAEETARGAAVTIVSNDLEVRQGISQIGGQAASIRDLGAHLNAPAKHLARQARHRAFLRQEIRDDEDSRGPNRLTGNPRRAPKKKRGKPDLPL